MWAMLKFGHDVARVILARYRVAAELGDLDDRCLRDIGLERLDIPAYVRSSRPWPASPSRPRESYRPALRGCG